MDTFNHDEVPPYPESMADRRRWEHSRLRFRMLHGQWRPDLEERVRCALGDVRSRVIGYPDISSNVFSTTTRALATLYDRTPIVAHPTNPIAGEAMVMLLEESGWTSLMQRFQADVLGLREGLIRVYVTPENITLRAVTPDRVIAEAHPADPDRPVYICEAIQRSVGGKLVWTWDELDIRNRARPTYRVLDTDRQTDITPTIMPSMVDYPYRRADGTPYLPYAMYHASRTANLWDPYYSNELVEGTLQAGVFWTMFAHGIKHASWPQRYMFGAEVDNDTQVDNGNATKRSEVVADPATVTQLRPTSADGGEPVQAMIGQWQAGAQPDVLFTAVAQYERRVAAFAGAAASDFVRVSGDPRSGYAIEISRAGQRECSARYAPCFRHGDQQLLSILAIGLNGARRMALPEFGYVVSYDPIPMTEDEKTTRENRILARLRAGIITPVEARMELEGESVEDATAAIGVVANARKAEATMTDAITRNT